MKENIRETAARLAPQSRPSSLDKLRCASNIQHNISSALPFAVTYSPLHNSGKIYEKYQLNIRKT